MRNTVKLLLAALVLPFCSFAQEDMPTIWEFKCGHKITRTGTDIGEDGLYSYAANDKEMTVFKNDDGSTVWTKPFGDIAPKLRKIDELIPFWESGLVFLFERKMGKDQIVVMDYHTGKMLWYSDRYQNLSKDNVVYIPEKDAFALCLKQSLVFVDAKTGEELWTTTKFSGVVGKYIYDATDQSLVMVNFKPTALGALFTGFRNQIVRIDINTGDVKWDQTYRGRAERKVLTKEFLFDLKLEEGKVLLMLNGIQVYDYKTGTALWSASYDFTPEKTVGKPMGAKLFGVYGAAADPVIVGNDVYVLDMGNKRNQFVKKYDRNSGRLLWTSEEIKDARVIPNMYVVDNRVVLQVGGVVEIQAQVEKKDLSTGEITTTWSITYPEVKRMGVQAFDTETGALAWDSERFRKGITNIIAVGNDVVVCSGKSLYKMDYKTGAETYEIALGDDGIGQATQILAYKDKVVIVGEKGVSTHDISSGKLTASAKYKKASLEDVCDNILLMKTEKADIAAYDLDKCDSYTEFKAKTGASTSLREDGKYVFVYENKVVTKVQTKL